MGNVIIFSHKKLEDLNIFALTRLIFDYSIAYIFYKKQISYVSWLFLAQLICFIFLGAKVMFSHKKRKIQKSIGVHIFLIFLTRTTADESQPAQLSLKERRTLQGDVEGECTRLQHSYNLLSPNGRS